MQTLGEVLRYSREKKKMILRKVSAIVDIDQSLISKFEKNERKPTKDQLDKFADFYDLSKKDLMINWYSEKIADELRYSEVSSDILKAAEEKINYYKLQGNGKQ